MELLENFHDKANFEHIRENLFKDTEYGRAAVMVGAGFSRNAEKFSPQVPDFPLAEDLAKIIYSKLHPDFDFSDILNNGDLILRMGENLSKYAEDYSKRFSKGELYNLLIKSIPDEKYQPGELHELLLSLPWSDVFTTNYDTLLERTLPKIHNKKYDIVKTATQIPLKSKPRLVKLHGDIPCNTFVITEEDYQNYKKENAAYQNLVQESILENVFCLIGFRGNDKNFECWKEWVHENLGDHAPPIFLCGILDLNDIERRKLDQAGIKLVDLGPLFPKEKFNNSHLRHKSAISWFLKSLKNGQPFNKLNWPEKPVQKSNSEPISLGPPILPPKSIPFQKQNQKYIRDPKDKASLDNNVELWKFNRETYPGWVIAPQDNRDFILSETQDSFNRILLEIDSYPFPSNISILFELNWRFELCLLPLFTNIAEKIENVLMSINPFPSFLTLEKSIISPNIQDYQDYNWSEIGSHWIDLAFSLLRQARESNNIERYQFWSDSLTRLTNLNSDINNRFFYEKFLNCLFNLDQIELKKTINLWSVDDNQPKYLIKKSSLLAELGELDEAKNLAEKALSTIRAHLHSNRDDFFLLSLEGWCMVLLQSIELNNFSTRLKLGEYTERWAQLARFNCNPWVELEKLKSRVSYSQIKKQSSFTQESNFEFDQLRQSYHMSSESNIINDLPGFAFLKLYENVGLPLHCGTVTMFSRECATASTIVEKYDPIWGLHSLIRTGEKEAIKSRFERLPILFEDETLVNHLYELIVNSLDQSYAEYRRYGSLKEFQRTFSYRQIKISLEVLSRLTIRLNENQLSKLLDFSIEIYSIQQKYPEIAFFDEINTFFKRIFSAVPPTMILKRMQRLLNLPIVGGNDFNIPAASHLHDPFEYIHFRNDFKMPVGYDRTSWDTPISHLIQFAGNTNIEIRKRSLFRLVIIYELNGLSQEEIDSFQKGLWAQIDTITQLPANTGFLNNAFLRLPQPSIGYAEEKIRKWLVTSSIPLSITQTSNIDGKPKYSFKLGDQSDLKNYVKTWINSSKHLKFKGYGEQDYYIDWSEEEILELTTKIKEYWTNQIPLLKNFQEKGLEPFTSMLQESLEDLLILFEEIVILEFDKISKDSDIEQINELLKDISQSGFCINSALPGVLLVKPEKFKFVRNEIRQGIFSKNKIITSESINGFYNWALLASNGKLTPPDQELISDFIYTILLQKEPGLSNALHIASSLLIRYPNFFTEEQVDNLILSLEKIQQITEKPDKKRHPSGSNIIVYLPDSEKASIQMAAIDFAQSLLVYFNKHHLEIPEVLSKISGK